MHAPAIRIKWLSLSSGGALYKVVSNPARISTFLLCFARILTGKRNLGILSLHAIQGFASIDASLDASTGVVPLAEETLAARGREGGDDAVAFLESPLLIRQRFTKLVNDAAELVAL